MRVAAGNSKKKPTKKTGGDKIVRRELNKVLTSGTLVDGEMLTDEQAGHCVSLRVRVYAVLFRNDYLTSSSGR
jgi:DNA mismatch repair protein MSH6